MAMFGPGSQDPWGDAVGALRRMQEEMNRTLGAGFVASVFPPVNVWRCEDGIVVTAEVPGVSLGDIEVVVHQNTLTIKGAKDQKAESKYEVLYQGIAARAFERRFQLADHVTVTGASLEHGLLHVDLVREIPEAQKPRTIAIGNGKAARVVESKVGKQAA